MVMGSYKSKTSQQTSSDKTQHEQTNLTGKDQVDGSVKTSNYTLRPLFASVQRHHYFQSLRLSRRRQSSKKSKKESTVAAPIDMPSADQTTTVKRSDVVAKVPIVKLVRSKSHSNIDDIKNLINKSDLFKKEDSKPNPADVPNKSDGDSNQTHVEPCSNQTLQNDDPKQPAVELASEPDQQPKNDNVASNSVETDTCTDYRKPDEDWDNSNKQNDKLIEDLRKQIDGLTQQLKTVGKEDSKVINELTTKIENLANINQAIIAGIKNESKRMEDRSTFQQKQQQFQQKKIFEEYYKRISHQNEILMSQQNQIKQMKHHLYNQRTTRNVHSTASTAGYYEPHSIPYSESNHYNRKPSSTYQYQEIRSAHHHSSSNYHQHYHKPYNHHVHAQPASRDVNNLYYDPVTRCYYYNHVVPTTTQTPPNVYYSYEKQSRDPHYNSTNHHYQQQRHRRPEELYVYTTEYIQVEEDDVRPSGVVITEIDD